jgi:phosphoribosylamine--glycine ligase
MLDGTLSQVQVDRAATVLTYKVPPSYGGYAETFPNRINQTEIGTSVDLSAAYALTRKYGDKIRIYPGSMELRTSQIHALKSRVVGVLGVGESIEEARRTSLNGIEAIKGGALWYRTDIASTHHIAKSVRHMQQLRLDN